MRAEARLFGVLGDPVEHSLSPAMQNAAFAARGLRHLYLRYRVAPESLPQALDEARRFHMGGLNLTIPLKEAALPLLDEVTPEARGIGAVNTILFRAGRLVGDNTDARGFLRAITSRMRLERAHVVVIGAGGSARAVGTALASAGCDHVTIANRTLSRADELAARLRTPGGPRVTVVGLDALAATDVLATASLVVNTTSTGLSTGTIAIRHTATPRHCLFMDLVYRPEPTPFLKAATRARRPAVDGTAMLLHQGALAFEAWTGTAAPLDAMRRALGQAGLTIADTRAVVGRGGA
ncbi:MAG: shikimate dehydrogenase [Candidatus Binatia bacterium]